MSFPVSLSRLLQTLITSLTLAAAPFAGAATWPDRPINLIMGFPAGSGVDVVARLIQEPLSAKLGQTIVIQYKPGAAGNIASEYVARAPADGYTLLFGTAATHGSNASLYKDLPFDVEEDFVAVAPVLDVSNALTVNPDVIDAKNLEEFVSIVRANPGKYAFASTGNGAGTHMAFAEFNSRLGLQLLHVPYKGGPEAITSVLRGETCCIMNQVQTVLSHYQAGKVRLLGVTTASPVGAVPDVPTIASSGVPGTENFNSTIWFGIFAPKGTDAAIVETINKAVQETLQDPAIRARFESQGNQVRLESPLQFRRTVHDNRQKWDTVIREANIRLE